MNIKVNGVEIEVRGELEDLQVDGNKVTITPKDKMTATDWLKMKDWWYYPYYPYYPWKPWYPSVTYPNSTPIYTHPFWTVTTTSGTVSSSEMNNASSWYYATPDMQTSETKLEDKSSNK